MESSSSNKAVAQNDPRKIFNALQQWIKDSENLHSVKIDEVLSAYEKEDQSALRKILKKMDSETVDGRITLWEFLVAADEDNDGISSTRDAAWFLTGNEVPPMFYTESESRDCHARFARWETQFALWRSLVVFLQGSSGFGDRGIRLENLNLHRVGPPLILTSRERGLPMTEWTEEEVDAWADKSYELSSSEALPDAIELGEPYFFDEEERQAWRASLCERGLWDGDDDANEDSCNSDPDYEENPDVNLTADETENGGAENISDRISEEERNDWSSLFPDEMSFANDLEQELVDFEDSRRAGEEIDEEAYESVRFNLDDLIRDLREKNAMINYDLKRGPR